MSVSALARPPQRRNRARKPSWSYAGLTAEQWQADSARVRWAQTDSMFRDIGTVLVNGRVDALAIVPGTSENRQLGRIEGYELAVATYFSLATGQAPPRSSMGEPDYPPEDGQQL